LLTLDKHPNNKTPGDYPIAWCKEYGTARPVHAAHGAELLLRKSLFHGPGRVFYTSLGHREDMWDPEWKDAKSERKNSAAIAQAYQQHILGGIKWALGLEKGAAAPQTK
jgi:type 1 glutamine amidotransferase